MEILYPDTARDQLQKLGAPSQIIDALTDDILTRVAKLMFDINW